MSGADQGSRENARITLGLLEAVESGRPCTQRRLAADLGIALGLVNIYLKRCINKGLVKVAEAPARRYAYYLTPQGFAEKSRLTGEYLTWSLTFFRRARTSCEAAFATAAARGWRRVALAGAGDLADIARICATDTGIEIAAIVEPGAASGHQPGPVPVLASFGEIDGPIDGVIVTALHTAATIREQARAAMGPDRVLCPDIVPIGKQPPHEDAT